jgi:hypothetical protein
MSLITIHKKIEKGLEKEMSNCFLNFTQIIEFAPLPLFFPHAITRLDHILEYQSKKYPYF